MAIDPRISLMAQTANAAPAINIFENALMNTQNRRLREQEAQRQAELQPLQNELLQQRVTSGQQAIDQGQIKLRQQRELQRINSLATFADLNQSIIDQAKSGNVEPLREALAVRATQLKQNNIDNSDTLEALDFIGMGNADRVIQGFDAARQLRDRSQGVTQTAGQRERADLIAALKSPDEQVRKSAEIQLGLTPRATGSAAQTIAETGKAEEVAQVEQTLASARKRGELQEKVKLEPQIKRAVDAVSAQVKSVADSVSKNKSNASALKVYESGIQSLRTALGDTTTGPLVGLLPAFTSEAQIADGAIAIMAPVLKGMFRSAGEGTFTDKDQELLLGMIPTRKDTPEAARVKLQALDNLVAAKLGNTEQGTDIEQALSADQPVSQNIGRFKIEVID